MKQLLFILSILFFALTSCKKKDPAEIRESPVFSFNGKFNNNQISYFSGTDNYYMYSSYATDVNNVREFVGELKLYGCSSPCNNSIKLRIKDYRTLSSTITDPDTSIALGYYAYSKPTGAASSYSVTFLPMFTGGAAQSCLWTFYDGTTTTPSVAVKVFTRNGQFNNCLSITSTSLCSSSICNTIYIGQTGDGVRANIINTAFPGAAVGFTASTINGTPPFTYNWDFGDGNTSALTVPTHTYATNGVYPVKLTITDANGKTGNINKNVATLSPGTCATNYTYMIQPSPNPLNLSNVILEWTDSNGITYTSEDNSQPSSSGFRITSIEEYKQNTNGQKTKKISASLNCTLYNGTSTLLLQNAELVFAIAYP